jgi:hypothetical protein
VIIPWRNAAYIDRILLSIFHYISAGRSQLDFDTGTDFNSFEFLKQKPTTWRFRIRGLVWIPCRCMTCIAWWSFYHFHILQFLQCMFYGQLLFSFSDFLTVVGIAMCHGLAGPAFVPVQIGPKAHPAYCTVGTGTPSRG